MLKKTVVYEDFNGIVQTEDLYFNLSKVELTEMEMSVEGGLSKALEKVADSKDPKELLKVLKNILIKSYGIKSEDGKRFIKNAELTEAFVDSIAFEEVYAELLQNPEQAEAIMKAILPKVAPQPVPPQIAKQ